MAVRSLLVLAGLAGLLLVTFLLLPSRNIDREDSGRLKCASNLKQIGQAIQIYVTAHGGETPDSFVTLLRSTELVPAVFVCPKDNAKPIAADAFTGDEAHCSYTYVGDRVDLTAAPPDAILAFDDRLENHDRDGLNVLFVDGHAEFVRGGPSPRERTQFYYDVRRQMAADIRPVVWPVPASKR